MTCTQASHARVKSDPAAFAKCMPIGMQDAGDGRVLALANCPLCHSTLAVEVPAPRRKTPTWLRVLREAGVR